MKSATAQGIIAANDLTIQKVETPEWGADVYIRQMKNKEADVFSLLLKGSKESQSFTVQGVATICALTLCDENGERLFPDHVQGAKQLGEKNSQVLGRVFTATMILSAISSGDTEETETPGKS